VSPLVGVGHEFMGRVHEFGRVAVEREGAALGVVSGVRGLAEVVVGGVDVGHVDLVALHGGLELVDVVLNLVEVVAGLEGLAVDERFEVRVEDVGDGVVDGFRVLVGLVRLNFEQRLQDVEWEDFRTDFPHVHVLAVQFARDFEFFRLQFYFLFIINPQFIIT
jgi:hypothetical protein